MHPGKILLLALMLMPLLAGAAGAHSLEELQDQLGQREQYFQPLDKAAPVFSLEDSEGKPVGLEDLRGKILVLHFIYTSCPDICPLHAEKLAEVQALINRTPMREQVRFLSITTDPAKDTAEIRRNYGPLHGLDPVNWSFLTTTPGQAEGATRQLAMAFGHKFSKTEDGYQTHGIVTHVIDRDGRWRANFHGLAFEPVNLVLFLNALTNVAVPHPHGGDQPQARPISLWDRLRGWF